jgi:hypothetical protein
MTDNLKKKGKADDVRINIHQAYELRYWTKRFKITQKRLKEVVKKAGPLVINVQRLLQQA